jgi:hypothetical protein
MTRAILPLSAIVLGLGLVTAAPIPEAAKKPKPFFPTQVGTKLVYRVNFRGNEKVLTKVVTAAENKGGRTFVILSSTLVDKAEAVPTAGKPAQEVLPSYTKFCLSEDGVVVVARKDPGSNSWQEKDPPCWEFKEPAKPGAVWKTDNPSEKYTRTCRVGKSERITVPAGTFEAIPVSIDAVHQGSQYPPQTIWFTRGLGFIKWVMGDELEEVLVSITHEKD